MRSLILFFIITTGGMAMENTVKSPYGPLDGQEKQVILEQGTERPFTGVYNEHFATGVYACRNCGAPLYRSDDKFRSSCGWPAFDDGIPGAVKRLADPDGRRTEIRCAGCGAHLGHVFEGERLTVKNTRHCVNSISLKFEPQYCGRLQRAVFAGGCIWGVEELMRRVPGVVCATNGYTGGFTVNPTYREVCSGKTGHVEAVEIVFDSSKMDFEKLCRYFLEIHDPTQANGQGPDLGSQYRSVIFYLDEAQKITAEKLLGILRSGNYAVVTKIVPFRKFWNAEAYHQDYYERKGTQPYCHVYRKRF